VGAAVASVLRVIATSVSTGPAGRQ
jgi:hypothetical protein